jgi:hypothetical protein
MLIVDRLNRRLCTRSLETLGALGGGRVAWPELPWSRRRRGPDERLTMVVALNAQLRRRVDLRPNQA